MLINVMLIKNMYAIPHSKLDVVTHTDDDALFIAFFITFFSTISSKWNETKNTCF